MFKRHALLPLAFDAGVQHRAPGRADADSGGVIRHRLGPGILTAYLISFSSIPVNIATGLATLQPELEDEPRVRRVLGAKRRDMLMTRITGRAQRGTERE